MEQFDGDVVEGGVGFVAGDVGKVAGGVAELAVGHDEMGFGFTLDGVDDVGGAERNVNVREVVLMEKGGFVRRDAHTENPDVRIFQDEMMMRLLGDGNGDRSLRVQRKCQKQQRRTKERFHREPPEIETQSEKKDDEIPGKNRDAKYAKLAATRSKPAGLKPGAYRGPVADFPRR
jgi:hypothetical protein